MESILTVRPFTVRRRVAGAWLAGLASFALASGACAPAPGPESGPNADRPARSAEQPPDTARVILDDYVIDMPPTLPPGRTVFRIVNEGQEDHNFLMDGDGTRTGIDEAIAPGETRLLTLDLREGAYMAICTWAGHDSRGMLQQIEVAPKPDDP